MQNKTQNPDTLLWQVRQRQNQALDLHFHSLQVHAQKLQEALRGSRATFDQLPQSKKLHDQWGSQWLPGPLSYPWLLMVLGLPAIVRNLTGLQ